MFAGGGKEPAAPSNPEKQKTQQTCPTGCVCIGERSNSTGFVPSLPGGGPRVFPYLPKGRASQGAGRYMNLTPQGSRHNSHCSLNGSLGGGSKVLHKALLSRHPQGAMSGPQHRSGGQGMNWSAPLLESEVSLSATTQRRANS